MNMLIQSDTLEDIADAIRSKAGTSSSMSPLDMPTNIMNIPTGGGGDDGVVAVYVDTSSTYVANQLFTYSATKTGKCTVSYFTGCRQTGATVKVNNGSTISPIYSKVLASGSVDYGYYFYQFDVTKNDSITVKLNYQGGTNSNHREYIVVAIEDNE